MQGDTLMRIAFDEWYPIISPLRVRPIDALNPNEYY